MKLTETECKNAKVPPGKKTIRLSDGFGLYLQVHEDGSKYWRYQYTHNGKRNSGVSLGIYPFVSLKDARALHFTMKRQLELGEDPGAKKQEARDEASITFGMVAAQFLAKMAGEWSVKSFGPRKSRITRYLLKPLGDLPIATISTQRAWAVLEDLQASLGVRDVVHRVADLLCQVFQFAVDTGAGGLKVDPTARLRKALTAVPTNHHAALKHPHQVGQLLQALEDMQDITQVVRSAFLVMVYCWPRTETLRLATWQEIDLGDESQGEPAIWTIPGAHMKRVGKTKGNPSEVMPDHLIPLPTQVVALLKDLKAQAKSETGYVFPSQLGQSRPMSDGTLRSVLRRLGYGPKQMQIHAWRAVAGTMLREQPALKFPLTSNSTHRELIEVQLAHQYKGNAEAPYNRAEYLADRITMLQTWADFVDSQKAQAAQPQPQARKARKPAPAALEVL